MQILHLKAHRLCRLVLRCIAGQTLHEQQHHVPFHVVDAALSQLDHTHLQSPTNFLTKFDTACLYKSVEADLCLHIKERDTPRITDDYVCLSVKLQPASSHVDTERSQGFCLALQAA